MSLRPSACRTVWWWFAGGGYFIVRKTSIIFITLKDFPFSFPENGHVASAGVMRNCMIFELITSNANKLRPIGVQTLFAAVDFICQGQG